QQATCFRAAVTAPFLLAFRPCGRIIVCLSSSGVRLLPPDAVAILHRRAETESYRTGQRGGPTRAAYGTFNYPFRPPQDGGFRLSRTCGKHGN
ncbi:MAG: hypothetical protein QOK44_2476, partial [Betaproteobacteria bacterium]|nr:hypothetical protein [Betaproteobacteria bacterium]